MTSTQLIDTLKKIAVSYKTFYVKGCYGAPLTSNTVDRYINQYTYNKDREAMIQAVTDKGYFGFDCICLIKGVIWGWVGDVNLEYGGAVYASNGLSDITELEMINLCSDVTNDFNSITPGEVVYMPGHVGIYIGNRQVVEATPAWTNGVLISDIGTSGQRTRGGEQIDTWQTHGKMPWVTYQASAVTIGSTTTTTQTDATAGGEIKVTVTLNELSNGSKGEQVKSVQQLLIAKGFSCGKWGADGNFGVDTEKGVKAYQAANSASCGAADGIVGPKTWASILGA